jgi:hypothetical protein
MTTVRDVRPDVLSAGFDFARRQDDPKFRRFLKSAGWTPKMGVMIALDEDKVVTVARRIAFNEPGAPCLIVIPNKLEPYGFTFLFAEVARVRWGRRLLRSAPQEIHPDSTIGMVWSSLQRCGEYIPGDWFQPVMFEKIANAAPA